MLANGSVFTYEDKVNAAYRVISYDANKVSKQLNSWFRAIEKLHQGVILVFDWFQSINPKANWVNYGVTLKNGFVAAGVPIHRNIKVKFYSFKEIMYLLLGNKLANSWLTFV